MSVPDTWQHIGALALEAAKEAARQRANAPSHDATPKHGDGDE